MYMYVTTFIMLYTHMWLVVVINRHFCSYYSYNVKCVYAHLCNNNNSCACVYKTQAKEVEDEDEVKVHATEDIEEGEVSSDEEGEIKG